MLSKRHSSQRANLALGGVQTALTALASLPDSERRRRLLGEAEACTRAIDAWSDRPPTKEEREAVMKRVLALNVAVAALQRSGSVSATGAEDEAEEEGSGA